MPRNIPESDWKQFKKVHAALLERFTGQILDEARKVLDGPGSSEERYDSLYGHLKKRNKELANAFDDFRRSRVIQQLVVMRGMKLLSDEELAQFS